MTEYDAVLVGARCAGSTVARRPAIPKERPQAGEVAFLFAYWRALPDDGYGTLDLQEGAGFTGTIPAADLERARWRAR